MIADFANAVCVLSGRSVAFSWQMVDESAAVVAPADWGAVGVILAVQNTTGYIDEQQFTWDEFLAIATVAEDSTVTVAYAVPGSMPAIATVDAEPLIIVETNDNNFSGDPVASGSITDPSTPAPPTALRWRTVQLQASMKDLLVAGMTSLGWLPTQPTWITSPLSVEDDWDAELVVLGSSSPPPNLVGVSSGEVGDLMPGELGSATPGGLAYTETPIFIDIYGESRAVALRIADDIRDILIGQQFRASRYLPIYDHSTDPATLVSDESCEMRLVQASWPQGAGEQEWRRAWRVVKLTARWYFNTIGLDAP